MMSSLASSLPSVTKAVGRHSWTGDGGDQIADLNTVNSGLIALRIGAPPDRCLVSDARTVPVMAGALFGSLAAQISVLRLGPQALTHQVHNQARNIFGLHPIVGLQQIGVPMH